MQFKQRTPIFPLSQDFPCQHSAPNPQMHTEGEAELLSKFRDDVPTEAFAEGLFGKQHPSRFSFPCFYP